MSSQTDAQRLRFLSEQRLFLADGLQHIANQVSFSAATDAGSDGQPAASATSAVTAADGFTDTGADALDPFEREAMELLAPRSDATRCITDLQQFRSYALQGTPHPDFIPPLVSSSMFPSHHMPYVLPVLVMRPTV